MNTTQTKLPSESACLTEFLNDQVGFFLRDATLLEKGQSAFQSYEVWDSQQFGKLFRLDGYFMTSERDEFFYHENLIHVPGVSHGKLEQVLIIGGGDGGSAEELFKYPQIKRVVLVELDASVIAIARNYFESVHRGSLNDPRLELRIEDGLVYVNEYAPNKAEKFDLIVLDLTDPIGAAELLYSLEFFQACKQLLNEGGALTLHIGSPIYQAERVVRLVNRLRAVFTTVSPYFTFIPLYGSLWGMACASDKLDPKKISIKEVDERIGKLGISDLNCYNGAIHQAQFALPNYLRSLLL